jgi:hypothetical protein
MNQYKQQSGGGGKRHFNTLSHRAQCNKPLKKLASAGLLIACLEKLVQYVQYEYRTIHTHKTIVWGQVHRAAEPCFLK